LHDLAGQFRRALERVPQNSFPNEISLYKHPDYQTSGFPAGCCGDSSELLAEFLKENGFDFEYVGGRDGGDDEELMTHAWLALDDFIVDITADQFNDCGYSLPKVFVEQESPWHDSFKIEEVREGSFYVWKDSDKNHFSNMERAYRLVLAQLD
jgi:hypothetical protein